MSENFDKNLDLGKELEEFEKLPDSVFTEDLIKKWNDLDTSVKQKLSQASQNVESAYNEIQNDMELLEIAKKEQENYESLEKQLAEHPENEVEIKAEMLAIEKKVDGLMAQIKPLETEEK